MGRPGQPKTGGGRTWGVRTTYGVADAPDGDGRALGNRQASICDGNVVVRALKMACTSASALRYKASRIATYRVHDVEF